MSSVNIIENNNQISFINLYSNDNPILEISQECYFIFFNSIDFHIPLIGKGKIVYDRFNDTINKHYFISMNQIIENNVVYDNFIKDKQFGLYLFSNDTLNISIKPKWLKIPSPENSPSFFANRLFRVECFFVRKDMEEIIKLRHDYKEIIRNDITKQLTQIDLL